MVSYQIQAEYDIREERVRQYRKWGTQNHNYDRWLAILMEEIGECSQAWLKAHYKFDVPPEDDDHFLEEAVQVAAVAQAIVENILSRRAGDLPVETESHG